ncbi:MAG: hypothetical protein IJR14_11315 [Synergistaceae bacterium]|nr:hypothetical protein [Synergistaceae bacterium]
MAGRRASVIESFIEGRARLRSPILRDAELAARLCEGLLRVEGVIKADATPRTGGLLLEYDKSRLPMDRIMMAAPILQRLADIEDIATQDRTAPLASLLEELREALR